MVPNMEYVEAFFKMACCHVRRFFPNQSAIMKKSCYAFPYVIARDLRILSKDSKTSRLNKP
jgi:hypothetical protein